MPGADGRRPTHGWGRPGPALGPLALLLRERYPSRAEFARATAFAVPVAPDLDGRWTADRLPPVRVLAAPGDAVGPAEVQRAVRDAMLARADRPGGTPPLTWGQRLVLEALRRFANDLFVATAPHVHDLLAAFVPDE